MDMDMDYNERRLPFVSLAGRSVISRETYYLCASVRRAGMMVNTEEYKVGLS